MDPRKAASLRNTPALIRNIDTLQTQLMERFQAVVQHAAVDKTDRNTTAHSQFQIQNEASHLIHAAEDLQTLIRNLQEMWLFGQLNTIGESEAQQQTDENAKTVASLMKQLSEKQSGQSQPIGNHTRDGSDHDMRDAAS